jgi:4-hydroxybenzoyl-CoA reductase subunit beta
MHLDPFELHRPSSVEESVALAQRFPGQFDFLAGGTDLLPNYKMHLNLRPHLISLDQVPELSGHSLQAVGGMERVAEIESDRAFSERYPAVAEAAREVATPLVRRSATVGGNLLVETRCFFFNQSYFWRESLGFCLKADGDACHVVPQKEKCYATFSGDLAPAFMVLDADVELAGATGRRELPLTELYDPKGDGIRRHRLAPGELLVRLRLDPERAARRSTYRKLRSRPSFDFPELGVAAALDVEDGRIARFRLALGGLETYPRRYDELTDPWIGRRVEDGLATELSQKVRAAVRPVHNTFLAPDYRKKMAGVFVRRALESLVPPGVAA